MVSYVVFTCIYLVVSQADALSAHLEQSELLFCHPHSFLWHIPVESRVFPLLSEAFDIFKY